ncbi:MAG: nucleotidyltransferase domain-containing protein [Bacilli bacterium]|nr:nucleotidyltransferase domain-containing protein [Bacilli bacterium]
MTKDTTFLFRVNTELKNKAMAIAKRNNVKLGSLLNAYLMDTVARDMIPINIRSKIRVFEKDRVSIPEIKKALNEIINKSYKEKVIEASLFGRYARGEERGDSDIDILITTDRDKFDLIDLSVMQDKLENQLGKEVDVVIKGGLRPEFLKEVSKDEIRIFERSR